MNLKIKKWEIAGIFLIAIFGTTLHFWFEWTDYWRPMAIIAAVNESTWEHFKMAFWPGLIFAIIEYFYLKVNINKFIIGKFFGLLTMPIITMIFFYSYTAFIDHNLIVDIFVFLFSIIGGQYVSYKILVSVQVYKPAPAKLALFGIILMIGAFSLLSYFPMKNFVFEHPGGHGEYGILDDYGDHDH